MKKIFIFCCIAVICVSCHYDTEYLGHYIYKVEYEEYWDEYVERTCTRTVHDGYDDDGNEITHEEEYDCSYVDYHYPKYYYTREDGRTIFIDEEQYIAICKKLGTKPEFVDMHRDYYTKDGDKYVTVFNGDRNYMWTLTEKSSYKNKVKDSNSIYDFPEVSDKEKKMYMLYDYPENFNYYKDQNPLIGIKAFESTIDSFQYLNAYYGGKYQFRCYVMIWKNAPMETAVMERNYLKGGNKNELVICISVDDKCKVQWVYAFSWEDKPYLSVGVNHLFINGERLDLMKLNRYLLQTVPEKWKRKEFKDFDYIRN